MSACVLKIAIKNANLLKTTRKSSVPYTRAVATLLGVSPYQVYSFLI